MKPDTEMHEGAEAFERFDKLVGTVLSIPHSVIKKREAEYRKQAAANPSKPGPKPKLRKR
jgi:hypothetical protein